MSDGEEKPMTAEEYEREYQRRRRERIATAALQGMLAAKHHPPPNFAEIALKYADSLIEKLDDDT